MRPSGEQCGRMPPVLYCEATVLPGTVLSCDPCPAAGSQQAAAQVRASRRSELPPACLGARTTCVRRAVVRKRKPACVLSCGCMRSCWSRKAALDAGGLHSRRRLVRRQAGQDFAAVWLLSNEDIGCCSQSA